MRDIYQRIVNDEKTLSEAFFGVILIAYLVMVLYIYMDYLRVWKNLDIFDKFVAVGGLIGLPLFFIPIIWWNGWSIYNL